MKIPHDPNEVLAVVDEKDNVIGKASRREVHEKGLLHREVVALIINSNKEVLLQKRLDYHVWDISAGGHFPFTQSYEEGVARECEEELGLKLKPKDFVPVVKERFSSKRISNDRFVKLFVVLKDISLEEINFDRSEIEEVRYVNKKELLSLLNSKEFVICAGPASFIERHILGKFV